MSWYYTTVTGEVYEATGTQKWILDRDIFVQTHTPLTPQTLYGPYATQADAQAAKAAHPPVSTQVKAVVTAPLTAAGNAIGPLLVRIGEAVLGVVLIAIAANVLLKQATGFDAAATGTKVAAAAAL